MTDIDPRYLPIRPLVAGPLSVFTVVSDRCEAPGPDEREAPVPLRGMRATILRPWTTQRSNPDNIIAGDYANDEVCLVGSGIPQLYRAGDRPRVVLGTTMRGYVVATPANPPPPGRYGFMASGAYIVQSGCFEEWYEVFGHYLPIPLHDHTEEKSER